jgi:hypothetical protein
MASDRVTPILDLLAAGSVDGELAHLCQVCAGVSRMSGASVTLMTERASVSVGTTNEISALLEDLQFTLGEGPGLDAYAEARPVLEPDLAHPDTARWPAFAPPAVHAGARAVFSFPLSLDSVHLGALNLYRDTPGTLTPDQWADGLVLGAVATVVILGMQAEAPSGDLAPELEEGADFRLAVHQAAGMVAAQLDVDTTEGLLWLRGYACSNDRSVSHVADDVLTGRLRFDDPPAPHES